MKIHEFQAKKLLADFGVPVPTGRVVTTPEEARQAAEELGKPVVVKAQIHAGGRGKGGGIKLAANPDEAEQAASDIIGMTLVTPQTGEEGKLVSRVLVEEQTQVERELYLSILVDNTAGGVTIIGSAAGGMEIEEVAATSPEKIATVMIDPNVGLSAFQVRQIGFALGFDAERVGMLDPFLRALYRLFVEKDASLAEINPLVLTRGGELIALDAKLNFDDSALYRHPDIALLRDPDEEDPREREAKEIDLAYVGLDGDIGCMVNGAGLAMATSLTRRKTGP